MEHFDLVIVGAGRGCPSVGIVTLKHNTWLMLDRMAWTG